MFFADAREAEARRERIEPRRGKRCSRARGSAPAAAARRPPRPGARPPPREFGNCEIWRSGNLKIWGFKKFLSLEITLHYQAVLIILFKLWFLKLIILYCTINCQKRLA